MTVDFGRARELVLLGLLTAVGFGLRAAYPDRMAVEHFDEGVYASNWFCRPPGLPDYTFPQQHLYAPPLLPAVYEWVLILTGSNPHSVMWVNVVLGTLMIPVVWGFTRSGFGSAAGLVAAALCAFSDAHITFSRAALTDVPLCLFLTAGVWAGSQAILTARPFWIALAGGLAALAWWTKYNGWLTLAITGSGLAGWLLFSRPQGVRPWRMLAIWGATAAVAFVLWWPVLSGLADVGGYSTVAQNHSRYVVGLSGWGASALRQFQSYHFLDSYTGIIAAAVAVTAGIALELRGAASSASRLGLLLIGMFLVAAGLDCGIALGLFGLAAFGIEKALTGGRRCQTDERPAPVADEVPQERRQLVFWIVVAWLAGLSLTTPLYTPYARIALPWLVAVWIAVAVFVLLIAAAVQQVRGMWLLPVGIAISLLGAVMFGSAFWFGELNRPLLPERAWQDRTGLREVAKEMVDGLSRSPDIAAMPGVEGRKLVIYVLAEPALFYHLSAMESSAPFRYFVQPVADLGVLKDNRTDPRMATYLAIGPGERVDLQPYSDRMEAIRPLPFQPSLITRLDREGKPNVVDPQLAAVMLYRVAP